jgi:hypothetical protein
MHRNLCIIINFNDWLPDAYENADDGTTAQRLREERRQREIELAKLLEMERQRQLDLRAVSHSSVRVPINTNHFCKLHQYGLPKFMNMGVKMCR